MTDAVTYLVVGSKPWNERIFEERIAGSNGDWHFIGDRTELTAEVLAGLAPRYVFFVHWSWMVPADIVDRFECVNFHMTDLPYGRGGSPLQNLIVEGHRHSVLTAHRMTTELDAGPVYAKADLCLEGTAEQVYIRMSELAAGMILDIVADEPAPRPQVGDVVPFARRGPQESRLPGSATLEEINDFVRMLDAEGYPLAFLEYGDLRLELRRAALYDGRVEADVRITLVRQPPDDQHRGAP